MAVVPLAKPVAVHTPVAEEPRTCGSNTNWVLLAAAGTLATSGVLLANRHRRAGLVTAAAGTALAMLDQQEAVRKWWDALPACLTEAQNILARVQTALDDIAAQRERLHQLLDKSR
jgi:hypothetical protein